MRRFRDFDLTSISSFFRLRITKIVKFLQYSGQLSLAKRRKNRLTSHKFLVSNLLETNLFRKFVLREKCPCSGFFWSVFSHIRIDTEYLSGFSTNAGKNGPEKLKIRILFTQCWPISSQCSLLIPMKKQENPLKWNALSKKVNC